jgi:hypothetical protein
MRLRDSLIGIGWCRRLLLGLRRRRRGWRLRLREARERQCDERNAGQCRCPS